MPTPSAGLCARLYTKLTAHTLCIYINRLLGQEDYLQSKKLAFPNWHKALQCVCGMDFIQNANTKRPKPTQARNDAPDCIPETRRVADETLIR